MGNCCFAEEALPAEEAKPAAEASLAEEASPAVAHYVPTIRAAIKYPVGARGIDLESKSEVDINAWLTTTVGHIRTWPYYVAYNDEEEGRAVSATAAHAKGILAWDGAPDGQFAWLCHSVPKYPESKCPESKCPESKYPESKCPESKCPETNRPESKCPESKCPESKCPETNRPESKCPESKCPESKCPKNSCTNVLPLIEHSELIYAQSFCFVEVKASPRLVAKALAQLALMRVHVTEIRGFTIQQVQRGAPSALTRLALAPGVVHIAKAPTAQLDIYEALPGARPWRVKSWLRGHEIGDTPGCRDIQELRMGTARWTRGQDHSKWAVATQGAQFFIGDLNRMKSQMGRGGGGFLIDSESISRTLSEAIV